MATVVFTPNLRRHVACPTMEVAGATVREVLDSVFEMNPTARGYVLDDQGSVRQHCVIFLNGRQILDPVRLSDSVPPEAQLYVMQALSGG